MEVPLQNQSKPTAVLPVSAAAMADHHVAAAEPRELPVMKIGSLAQGHMTRAVDLDETDCSTSFADTTSTNQANSATVSDAEVESQFYSDVSRFSPPLDCFGPVLRLRKKRLTSHWRNFIRPLMWRCKWAELKMKQFESQAKKYAKNIAASDLTKHLASSQSIPEGFSSRSMPYTQKRQRKLMKRRKRVRVEETTDADLYMSQHILFSYHESKKSDADGLSMTEDIDDAEQTTISLEELGLGKHNSWSFLEDKDNEMEHILHKIDTAHSRVHKLKAQLDLVISENSQMFSFPENINHCATSEAQTSSVHSPVFGNCNGDAVLVEGVYSMTRHNSEFDTDGNLDMPEHMISNYGESFHIPDVIESTLGTLSSVDVTQHHAQIGDSCENILDNMLVHEHEETAEAERQALIKCQQGVIVKTEEEEESSHVPQPINDAAPQQQPTLKSSLASEFQIPKNKGKRGERKAGAGNWSRQCPGEAESQ